MPRHLSQAHNEVLGRDTLPLLNIKIIDKAALALLALSNNMVQVKQHTDNQLPLVLHTLSNNNTRQRLRVTMSLLLPPNTTDNLKHVL
jgi:hypothetical protein